MRYGAALLVLATLLVITSVVWAGEERGRGYLQGNGDPLHTLDGRTHTLRPEVFALDNGLQVVALPMPGMPGVTVMIWYKVGAADDPVGTPGLAHLVEHATFSAMETHAARDATRLLAHHSALEADAFTSYDYTAYSHVVPVEHLGTVLQTEAHRMSKLVITPDILAPEQEEVLEERHAEVTNVPEARFDEHLRAALYGMHPYGVPVLGWPDDIQRLTAREVNAFYHTWYAPNNAILIVAGDITTARLAPLVKRYYGNIPARAVPVRHRPTVAAPHSGQRLVMHAPQGHTPLWQRMSLAPSYNAGETTQVYALQVLKEILVGEPEGRLYRQLVVEQRLATAIDIDYLPDRLGITDFTLSVMSASGVAIDTLEQAIVQALAAVIAQGVSPADVRRAQQRLQHLEPLARAHGPAGAEILGMALATGHTLAALQQWRERMAAVTPGQVQAAARAVLGTEHTVTGVLLPAAGGNVTRTEELWIEKR
jgi:zinc protease